MHATEMGIFQIMSPRRAGAFITSGPSNSATS